VAEAEERFYTVEEANAAIEDLREALPRIREARLTILRAATRIKREAATDGGGQDGPDYWAAMRVLREEVEARAARIREQWAQPRVSCHDDPACPDRFPLARPDAVGDAGIRPVTTNAVANDRCGNEKSGRVNEQRHRDTQLGD
jgi:hypothetical protein